MSKTKMITCEAGDVIQAGKFSIEFIHGTTPSPTRWPSPSSARWVPSSTPATSRSTPPHQGGMIDLARSAPWDRRGCWLCWPTPPTWSARATPAARAAWANSFDALFKGCQDRIIVTTFASNVDRLQQIINGRPGTGARWRSPAGLWRTP